MKVIFLGGTGEYGRSSYAILSKEKNILLDFGVKRTLKKNKIGSYPKITGDIAKKIDISLLSHAHDDHSSALPLLYKKGYKGKIYATEETIKLAHMYVENWIKHVETRGGKLPYETHWKEAIAFSPISIGENNIEGLKVTTGRSGHMLGSVWFSFTIENKRIFYSGDLCFESMLFAYDLPNEIHDIAIIDASYGVDDTHQEELVAKLQQKVKEIIERGGNILFPVPIRGRGSELLLILNELQDYFSQKKVKVYVEGSILDEIKAIKDKKNWLKEKGLSVLFRLKESTFTKIDDRKKVTENLVKGNSTIIVANDAMLSGGSSPVFFEYIKGNKRNGVIFTGYTAPGTLGAKVLTPKEKARHNVECETINLRIKVHLGFPELKKLLSIIRPKHAFLVHCSNNTCRSTASQLKKLSINIHCFEPGDTWLSWLQD